jgi:glycerophosphoryl diester phosphodiesterase
VRGRSPTGSLLRAYVELVLAHDPDDAIGRTPMTLTEGLDHFAAEAYNGIELDVDLKIPGV